MKKIKINTFALNNFIIASITVLGSMYIYSMFYDMKERENKRIVEYQEEVSIKYENFKSYDSMKKALPRCDKVSVNYSSMQTSATANYTHLSSDQLDKLIDNMKVGSGARLWFSMKSSKSTKPECSIDYATNEYIFIY